MFWKNIYVLYIGIPAGIVVVSIGVSWVLRFLLSRFLKKSSDTLKVDKTRYNFLKNAVSSLVFLSALCLIFYVIPELRSLGLTLLASAGIFAAIVGLASQQAFSNIISGIFIVIFKPFRVGDIVKLGESFHGIVEDITLRHTIIKNFENRRIVMPNSSISSETIVNSSITEEEICAFIEINISYDSNIDLAMSIMQEEALKHPNIIDKRTPEEIAKGDPQVAVRLLGFGESSMNLRAYAWAQNTTTAFDMKCDLNVSIKKRFDKEGIEIPFPYRTLVFKDNKDKDRLQGLSSEKSPESK